MNLKNEDTYTELASRKLSSEREWQTIFPKQGSETIDDGSYSILKTGYKDASDSGNWMK